MKGGLIHTAVFTACLAAAVAAPAKDIRTVRAIEFKGLRLLSKYDVVRGARFKAVERGIVIDMESLEKALAGNGFISSSRVEESKGRLIITVAEKVPAIILAVEGKSGYSLYELDANHAVISKNNVHTDLVPVLYEQAGKPGAGGLPGGLKNILSFMAGVRKNDAALYREISEIYPAGSAVRILLRGRKTGYIVKPEEGEFIRLKYIAGYCDRTGRSPEEINLSGNAVVVR
jgi:hypothetical protein